MANESNISPITTDELHIINTAVRTTNIRLNKLEEHMNDLNKTYIKLFIINNLISILLGIAIIVKYIY